MVSGPATPVPVVAVMVPVGGVVGVSVIGPKVKVLASGTLTLNGWKVPLYWLCAAPLMVMLSAVVKPWAAAGLVTAVAVVLAKVRVMLTGKEVPGLVAVLLAPPSGVTTAGCAATV